MINFVEFTHNVALIVSALLYATCTIEISSRSLLKIYENHKIFLLKILYNVD